MLLAHSLLGCHAARQVPREDPLPVDAHAHKRNGGEALPVRSSLLYVALLVLTLIFEYCPLLLAAENIFRCLLMHFSVSSALQVSGIEGNFRTTCEAVNRVLRDNKDSVMAMLEAFVH